MPVITATELSYIKIAEANKPVIEIKANAAQSAEEAQYNISSLLMVQPYRETMGVDSSKLETFIAAIAKVAIVGFVDDAPKDLSLYGLDKPANNIIIKDKTNTLNLIIGKDKDSNLTYFKTDASNSVYTMDKSVLAELKITPFDIVQKFAYIVNIDLVDQITVESNGKVDTIAISRTVKKAEKAGETDVTTTFFKLNGKDIAEDVGKKLYQSVIGLTADGELDKSIAENPEVKITFTLNKGTKNVVQVNYVPYNADFDAVFKDGKSEFVISKSRLTAMFDAINKLK